MATEKRLIDANALKEQIIKEIHCYWNNGDGGYYLAEDVIPDIEDAPTVDAVEVVRCRNCEHWQRPWLEGQTLGKCQLGKTMITEPDHFCSYGERREGE